MSAEHDRRIMVAKAQCIEQMALGKALIEITPQKVVPCIMVYRPDFGEFWSCANHSMPINRARDWLVREVTTAENQRNEWDRIFHIKLLSPWQAFRKKWLQRMNYSRPDHVF